MTQQPGPLPHAVHTRAEYAAGLTAVRRAADLSIRQLARQAGVPSATLGGYFSGRNLPQPGQLNTLRTALRVCGLDQSEIEAWVAATERVRASGSPPGRGPSPYPGLTSFRVADAALFHGREAETTRLLADLERLRHEPGPSHGIVAVIGASGSGKTSLLRAGVAAYLDRLDRCVCLVRTPTTTPAAVLAEARDLIGAGPGVLVLDQFEELFAPTVDPVERSAFVADLLTLAPGTLTVLGMRADFYGAAAAEPGLLPVLQHGQHVLGPLTADAVRDAVLEPARSAGVTVDTALADLVLADLAPRGGPDAHDTGALPLLSHALRAAWERSESPRFTVDDYREAGGITGAVQRSAEEAYLEVDPAARADLRSLFLRLVSIDDIAVTRRRIDGTELAALHETGLTPVIDEFVARRLLTVGDGTLEISHEALLTAWPRLRAWVDEDRAGLVLHRQLTEATNAWERSGRDAALLLRGARLDAALELAADGGPHTVLTATERELAVASEVARDAARARARRITRRLRRQLAAVAVLFLVSAVLAGLALKARSNADGAERDASAARDAAQSRQLAIEAAGLTSSNPALAQQLAVAAFRVSPTAEARGAVIDASTRPIVTRLLGRFGYAPLALDGGRDLAAVGQAGGGEVELVSVPTSGAAARVVARLRAPGGGAITGVALTPDGRRLYAVTARRHLVGFDVGTPSAARRTADLTLGGLTPRAAAVSSNGSTLVVGGAGGDCPVRTFALTSGAPSETAGPCPVPVGSDVQTVALSPDGRYVAAAGRASDVHIWQPGTSGSRVVTVSANYVFSLLFAPGRLYIGDSDSNLTVVDPASGRRLGGVGAGTSAWVLSLALSPDGRTLAAGGSDSTLREYDVTSLRQTGLRRFPTQVTGVAYLGAGRGTIATAGDGATYVTPARGTSAPMPATTFNLSFDRTGSRMAAATDGGWGGVRAWDIRGTVPQPVGPLLTMTGRAGATGTGAINPAGTIVSAGNVRGEVQLFDLRDPARPAPFGPPFRALADATNVESQFFSPRGDVLAVGGDDHAVSLWDVRTPARPRLLARLRGTDTFYGVAWNATGTLLAGANVDSHVYLWSTADPAAPRRVARLGGFDQEVWGVAISPDGHYLAGTGSDRTTRVWDISRPDRPTPHGLPYIGPTDYVYSASFNRDSSLLAVSSNDRTVRVYDLRSSQRTPLVTLDGLGGAAFAVAFSPDGRHLVAGGRSDGVAVWTTDPAGYSRRLCARAGTPITRDEWAQLASGATYAPPCR